jgi:hypothetical protein
VFKQLYSTGGTGPKGKIDAPAVGLLIAEITAWDLKRREDGPPGKGEYVLRASFSYISEWMFNDPGIDHRIIIEIGRGQQYRLEPDNDARTVLDGRSLLIEGITICRL